MIRKVYEVDPMICPNFGTMKIIAFFTEFGAVDRIIDQPTFVAAKPRPSMFLPKLPSNLSAGAEEFSA